MGADQKDKSPKKPRGLWKRIFENIVKKSSDNTSSSDEMLSKSVPEKEFSETAEITEQPDIFLQPPIISETEPRETLNEERDIDLSWEANDFYVEAESGVDDPWCHESEGEESIDFSAENNIEPLIDVSGIDENILFPNFNLEDSPQQENAAGLNVVPSVQAIDPVVETYHGGEVETVSEVTQSSCSQLPEISIEHHSKVKLVNDMKDIISGMIKILDELRSEPNIFKEKSVITKTVTKQQQTPDVTKETLERKTQEDFEPLRTPVLDEGHSAPIITSEPVETDYFVEVENESDDDWGQNGSEQDVDLEIWNDDEEVIRSSSSQKTREDDIADLAQYAAEDQFKLENAVQNGMDFDSEDINPHICLSDDCENYDDDFDSFGAFEYEPDLSESPWKNHQISSPKVSKSRDKSAEIVSLMDLVTEREREEASDYLDNFFLANKAYPTFKALYKIVTSGIGFSTLKDIIILREVWEEHPEWRVYKKYQRGLNGWDVQYSSSNISWDSCTKIAIFRQDYSPEDMVSSEWYDEWQNLESGHELYFSFLKFVLFKILENKKCNLHVAFSEYYDAGNISDINDDYDWYKSVHNGQLLQEQSVITPYEIRINSL